MKKQIKILPTLIIVPIAIIGTTNTISNEIKYLNNGESISYNSITSRETDAGNSTRDGQHIIYSGEETFEVTDGPMGTNREVFVTDGLYIPEYIDGVNLNSGSYTYDNQYVYSSKVCYGGGGGGGCNYSDREEHQLNQESEISYSKYHEHEILYNHHFDRSSPGTAPREFGRYSNYDISLWTIDDFENDRFRIMFDSNMREHYDYSVRDSSADFSLTSLTVEYEMYENVVEEYLDLSKVELSVDRLEEQISKTNIQQHTGRNIVFTSEDTGGSVYSLIGDLVHNEQEKYNLLNLNGYISDQDYEMKMYYSGTSEEVDLNSNIDGNEVDISFVSTGNNTNVVGETDTYTISIPYVEKIIITPEENHRNQTYNLNYNHNNTTTLAMTNHSHNVEIIGESFELIIDEVVLLDQSLSTNNLVNESYVFTINILDEEDENIIYSYDLFYTQDFDSMLVDIEYSSGYEEHTAYYNDTFKDMSGNVLLGHNEVTQITTTNSDQITISYNSDIVEEVNVHKIYYTEENLQTILEYPSIESGTAIDTIDDGIYIIENTSISGNTTIQVVEKRTETDYMYISGDDNDSNYTDYQNIYNQKEFMFDYNNMNHTNYIDFKHGIDNSFDMSTISLTPEEENKFYNDLKVLFNDEFRFGRTYLGELDHHIEHLITEIVNDKYNIEGYEGEVTQDGLSFTYIDPRNGEELLYNHILYNNELLVVVEPSPHIEHNTYGSFEILLDLNKLNE